jgi:2'-5' RNA ligase
MKKIYAISCIIELIEKPDWLDAFCAQYNRPHPLHITLKQMAYIDKTELPKIQQIFEDILKSAKPSKLALHVVFDDFSLIEHDDDDGTGWIYVFANQRNQVLDDLQKEIREKLAHYSDYYLKDSRLYEHNFRPHITIAAELDPNNFVFAVAELPKTVRCVGEVVNITLSCVKEPTLAEANDLKNLIVYDL